MAHPPFCLPPSPLLDISKYIWNMITSYFISERVWTCLFFSFHKITINIQLNAHHSCYINRGNNSRNPKWMVRITMAVTPHIMQWPAKVVRVASVNGDIEMKLNQQQQRLFPSTEHWLDTMEIPRKDYPDWFKEGQYDTISVHSGKDADSAHCFKGFLCGLSIVKTTLCTQRISQPPSMMICGMWGVWLKSQHMHFY